MTLSTRTGRGGLEYLHLVAADGASAEIHAHGAHLTSWIPAGGGERLYLSERAEFRPGAAIRGGVPVIFPQFAAEGPLPRHGFARVLAWSLLETSQPAQGPATARFQLRDSAASRAIWPHAFKAGLEVSVGADRLELRLDIENSGDSLCSFTAALHSYLRVDDIAAVELRGLRGLHYRDSARGGVRAVDSAAALRFDGEVDRIYFDAPPALELAEPRRRLRVGATGFADAVVWNPGAERAAALADLEPDGYRRFVCVEAAAIGKPVRLAPGERWSGAQHFQARNSSSRDES